MARQSASVGENHSQHLGRWGGRFSSGDFEFAFAFAFAFPFAFDEDEDDDDDGDGDGVMREGFVASSFCCIVLGLYGRSNCASIAGPVSASSSMR